MDLGSIMAFLDHLNHIPENFGCPSPIHFFLIFLFVKGADVNGRNCLGCVPLMYAAGSGHLQVGATIFYKNVIAKFCVDLQNFVKFRDFFLRKNIKSKHESANYEYRSHV